MEDKKCQNTVSLFKDCIYCDEWTKCEYLTSDERKTIYHWEEGDEI